MVTDAYGRAPRRPAAARLRRTSSRCPASPPPTPSSTRRSAPRSTRASSGSATARRSDRLTVGWTAPCCRRSKPRCTSRSRDYTHIVGRELVEEIRELAEPLEGKRVLHVSATAFGGGVSEILYTLVPLMRDVGLDAHWQVILGREEFFNAPSCMHNSLQGDPSDPRRASSGSSSTATTR